MPIRSLLRISPAVWISPVLVLLSSAYSSILPPITSDPYPLALTATGAFSTFLIAPVCAACAAWEGGRLKRADWFGRPHVRSTLVVVLSLLMPVLVVGIMSVTIAATFTLLNAGVTDLPDSRVLLTKFIIITAHALFGFAVGLHVPTVVAVPAILLLDYTWMVVPDALEPLWLRHLTGAWSSCCHTSSELAPQAVVSAIIVAVGVAGTAILLLRRNLEPFHATLAGIPLVLALIVGALLVSHMGPSPVIPRSQAVLVCSSSQPTVCLWPEHRTRLTEVSEIAVQASQAWQRMGVSFPTEFTEWSSLLQGERHFGFSLEANNDDILNSLSYSIIPPYPACMLEGGAYIGGPAEAYVLAWLNVTAGMSHDELQTRFGPDISLAVLGIQSLPVLEQRAWYEYNVTALSACNVAPQLEAVE